MNGEPEDWEEALAHPLRQVLFTLLRHRPANAAELQAAVGYPLQGVVYHLGILVDRGCLFTEREEGRTRYRLNPRAAQMLPRLAGPEVESERVVMMSLLDAAWTAIGSSPERGSVVPTWEAHRLDEDGLLEASAVVADALDRIRRIAGLSRERQAAHPEEGKTHMLVAVASLIEKLPEEPGGASR